jgi:predicted Fe-S protein YdhL (DUF1289 family)
MNDIVQSPCLSICFLDEEDVCMGCYRNAQEITDWQQLSSEQRTEVLKLVVQRRVEQNPHTLL